MKIKIENGLRFGKLTVLKEGATKVLPSGQKNRVFICKCDCGNEKEVRLLHLVRNRTLSCGCSVRTRNGIGNSLLIKVWRQMIVRCSEKEKNPVNIKNYYDKGIRVSDEFMDSDYFYKWSMENGYKKGLQIDRIDNNKGYSPDNCRWTTQKINANNKETTFYVIYNGEKKPIKFVLEDLGLSDNYNTILNRIKRGWNHQKAIDTPIRLGNYKRGNKTSL